MITFPRGTDFCQDLFHIFGPAPIKNCRTIFDVGANVGQSAHRFTAEFQNATIYCFEPVSSAFTELKKNTEQYPNVKIYNFAMGRTKGTTMINVGAETALSSCMHCHPGDVAEPCLLETIDSFCASHNINTIDILKIDAEGMDLDVLEGAEKTLDKGKIAFIEVEACLEDQKEFVPLSDIIHELKPFNFSVFGIYNQMPYLSGNPMLSYFNAVFINTKLVKENK